MFEFCIDDNTYSRIHFIGIGGISMSGLAEILMTEGYKVSGSDAKRTAVVEKLENLGADIYIGQNKENIEKANADLIIYTDAISSDNEELIAAQNSGTAMVDRASFLGAIMKNYKKSIAISGTHGKTSTTSMLTTIFNSSTFNPTILLGGQLNEIGGNVKLGSKDIIITEACEYKANILKYYPTTAVILNIDEDHLDFFKNMDHIIDTFIGYARNLKDGDNLIINVDDPYTERLVSHTRAKITTFGIDMDCDYRASNILYREEGCPSYTLTLRDGSEFRVNLSVPGTHNVYNSLGSIAAAHTNGLKMENIITCLEKYTGVQRRLEFKGMYNNSKILDDYAHHPTEIKATLNALRESHRDRNIYCVFQPHTYTRTSSLLTSFANSFKDATKVIITDIYAAREKNNGSIHSRDLVNAIAETDAMYIGELEDVEDYLMKTLQPNDIVVTMGAGNVYTIGENILHKNSNISFSAI